MTATDDASAITVQQLILKSLPLRQCLSPEILAMVEVSYTASGTATTTGLTGTVTYSIVSLSNGTVAGTYGSLALMQQRVNTHTLANDAGSAGIAACGSCDSGFSHG